VPAWNVIPGVALHSAIKAFRPAPAHCGSLAEPKAAVQYWPKLSGVPAVMIAAEAAPLTSMVATITAAPKATAQTFRPALITPPATP
jgi:hypothetical protein